MIAVIPVRSGQLPVGAFEAARATGGVSLVIGDGTAAAAEELLGVTGSEPSRVRRCELGTYSPASFAARLSQVLEREDVIVLPATPDGRDLAPHIAACLGRPLLAGAIELSARGARVTRFGGAQIVDLVTAGPFVATVVPLAGAALRRSAPRADATEGETEVELVELADDGGDAVDPSPSGPEVIAVLPPLPATVDLSEADRIVSGGGGLGGVDEFTVLEDVAALLGASVGATRVVTDAGFVDHSRQIGTTGVSVRPRCYVAFGVSGAAQHVGGLGEPHHVISVNLDASCPMMAMSDLAIVADAAATLRALAERLAER